MIKDVLPFRWLLAIALVCFAACSDDRRRDPVCTDDCPPSSTCGDGICEGDDPINCPSDCFNCDCIDGYSCNGSSSGCSCNNAPDGYCPETCPDDPDCTVCTPDCDGRVCGDDGCGGKCGRCESGERCNGGQCVSSCVPDCSDKMCGSDGCDGICGPGCAEEEACIEFQCVPPDPRCGDLDPVICHALDWGWCADGWVWRTPSTEISGSISSLLGGEERIWVTGQRDSPGFHDGRFLHGIGGPEVRLADVWRTPAGHIWGVGPRGTIFLGDGDCWAEVPSPTRAHLNGIWATEAGDLWAVGHDATVLRFMGGDWIRQPLPAETLGGWSGDIIDVWGSGDDVWMVGTDGLIMQFDGSGWTRHRLVWWDTPDFHRVFARNGDVWVLENIKEAAGWAHFDGSEWEVFGRPLLYDISGEGEDVWRTTWGPAGRSITGEIERSRDGGATFTPLDGFNGLISCPKRAFGGELWALQGSFKFVRIVNDQAVPIGDPVDRDLAGVRASLRLPSGEWLAMGESALFRHKGADWEPEALPPTLQGSSSAYLAMRGNEVWAANLSNLDEGPVVGRWKGGEWSSTVVPPSLAQQAWDFGCSGSECFLAAGSKGVLRYDQDIGWSRDTFEYTPADGEVVALAMDESEVWMALQHNGNASLHRRGRDRWEQVGKYIAPVTALARGAGGTWALSAGFLYRAEGDTLTDFGTLGWHVPSPAQWRGLLIDEDRVYVLTHREVCISSVETLSPDCLMNPIRGEFTRLLPSPTGVWIQTSNGTYLELRR